MFFVASVFAEQASFVLLQTSFFVASFAPSELGNVMI
jgi:hypothetical protein